jgi:hypothetical protein
MTKTTPVVLLLAICLCAVCALFPPRRINNTSSFQFIQQQDGKLASYDVPHAFLFSPDFGIYRAPGSAVFPAEVDGGRLLAQLVLIGALTGVVMLVPSLLQSKKNERSRDA